MASAGKKREEGLALRSSEPIRAAGGVIFTQTDTGENQVLLVHRPAYDDWTFPKGKLQKGESIDECALREVQEETGFACELIRELSGTTYIDRRGRPKTVRYWEMKIVSGKFEATKEVDKSRWLSFSEAANVLSYPHDLDLLDELATAEMDNESLLLIRHASAGNRKDWGSDDKLRPLDEKGKLQALELAETLGVSVIKQVLSSPYLRCIQTVEPLAERLGLPVQQSSALAEGAGPASVRMFISKLEGLPAAICTHGDVVEELVGPGRPGKKASVWLLKPDDGLRPFRYMPPPEV